MVPMYAKTMDTAAAELDETPDIGIKVGDQKIPALIFMDDLGRVPWRKDMSDKKGP